MKLDDTAAAYGLFQVVFTYLTDQLAVATFHLRRFNEPGLAFEAVFKQEFSRLLKQFQGELRRFDPESPVKDSVGALTEACAILPELAKWRNDRVHARVRMTEDGLALYDWRTGRRLAITAEELVEKSRMLVNVIVALEAHLRHLIGALKWEIEAEKLFSDLFASWESGGEVE